MFAFLIVTCVASAMAENVSGLDVLFQDDECAGGGEVCGLNALQLSAASSEAVSETSENDAYSNETVEGAIWTLYHVTSPSIGPKILKGGFHPGHVGWCGGGIYFALSPAACRAKAIGVDSHMGFLIEAKVDVGRITHYPATCLTSAKCVASHPGHNGILSCLYRGHAAHHMKGGNTIVFNPGDGDEVVIANPRQVKSMRQVPWR